MITSDAKCHVEIRRRIAMGKDAFYKRKELLRRKLNKNLKKRIIKSMIWSVVLYGLLSETWTMRKEDIKRLEAFEMWIWRRMERISWIEPGLLIAVAPRYRYCSGATFTVAVAVTPLLLAESSADSSAATF